LDHTHDHAYQREGNSAEVIRVERSKIQHLRDCLFPGKSSDLVRVQLSKNQWSWALFDPASTLGKEYVVLCRPELADSTALEEYSIILEYFRFLCYLPAIQQLGFPLDVGIMYDRMYKGTIVGASPSHKYIIFSPSAEDWGDPNDYQFLKTTDPIFPSDVRLLSTPDLDKRPPFPSGIIRHLFHEVVASWEWADVARIMRTQYHDIVSKEMKEILRPEDLVTLGTQITTRFSEDAPRFCITMCMLPESATAKMKELDKTNMHYIHGIETTTTAPRYTRPPLVYIEEPSIKTSPNDSIRAVAVCSSVDASGRPGDIIIYNPGLYRKESDDPIIVPPKIILLPTVWNDRKKLPIKIEIFPVDRRLGCQPSKESDIKDSYLVQVIYTPPPLSRTVMKVKTLGWFVPIDKYFTVKKNFREMLQYTVDVIAVEMGVNVILLDDQSYMNIYGLTNNMMTLFNDNPEQLEPLKQGQAQKDRKPRPLLHPPFYKVLRSLCKGETLYTEMGFVCLPGLFLNAVDAFLDEYPDPGSLDQMITLMRVLSKTVGNLIHGLAASLSIDEFLTRDEIASLLLVCETKKRNVDGTFVTLLPSISSTTSVSEVATLFIRLFRQYPATSRFQDYHVTLKRTSIWNLYSQFSRQVFTFEKKWIRDMNSVEGQTAFFHLYMSFVLQYVTINEEEEIWTSERLLTRLLDIRGVLSMDFSMITYILGTFPVVERKKMLRVLLWGYNSVFASTRMYRNSNGVFQFKTLSRSSG
jgi:hypothetical protein